MQRMSKKGNSKRGMRSERGMGGKKKRREMNAVDRKEGDRQIWIKIEGRDEGERKGKQEVKEGKRRRK